LAGFNRIPAYSEIYLPEERAENIKMRMVRGTPPYAANLPARPGQPEFKPETAEDLVSYRCISCHTLERIHLYKHTDWDRVVGRMRAYGMRLTDEEMQKIVTYLSSEKAQESPPEKP